MDDLLKVFLAETSGCLAECDADIEKLRHAPGEAGALDNILRQIRTIRETSGFLGLPRLHGVASEAIDGIAGLRAGGSDGLAGALPAVIDYLTQVRTAVSELIQPKAMPTAASSAAGESVLATKRPSRKRKATADQPVAADAEEDAAPEAPAGERADAPIAPAPAEAPPTPAADIPRRAEPAPAAMPPVSVSPAVPAPAADGTVRVSAEMIENLLSTVSRLMATQTEMMQLLRTSEAAAARQPGAPLESPVESPMETPAIAIPAAALEPAAQVAPAPAPAERGKVVTLPLRGSRDKAGAAEPRPSPAAVAPAAARPELSESAPGSRLLVFQAGDGVPKAIAVDQVLRLDEVDLKAVDGSHGLWVQRSGSELMPLVPLSPGYRLPDSGRAPAIFVAFGGQSFGLLVDSIGDVVEARLQTLSAGGTPGCVGTALAGGRVVTVIDPAAFLAAAMQTGFRPARPQPRRRPARETRPVLAELPDDLFVRKPAR